MTTAPLASPGHHRGVVTPLEVARRAMAPGADGSIYHVSEHVVRHQPDHRPLMTPLPPVIEFGPRPGRLLDLLVVPTSRPFSKARTSLAIAADLARSLGASMLVLCSGLAHASAFRPEALGRDLPRSAAVELPASGVGSPLLPRFHTSTHAFAGSRWTWKRDVAAKRNLGLLLARAFDRRRLLFLDDDVLLPTDVSRADHELFGESSVAKVFGQVGATWSVAGWTMTQFPDNSVVCHARRALGYPQTSFPGGGALAVDTSAAVPFFPAVYNEDWLFMYDYLRGAVEGAVTGVGNAGFIGQAVYSPFARGRSASEEFGDTLAEGLFNALGAGCARDAVWSEDYWRRVIGHRARMIAGLIRALDAGRGESLTVAGRADIREAMEAALARHRAAEQFAGGLPRLMHDFMVRWHGDRAMWRQRLARATPATTAALMRGWEATYHDCSSLEDLLAS